MLLSLNWPAIEIILTACFPVLIAVLAVASLDFYSRKQNTTGAGSFSKPGILQ
jgi:hypothetical protein